MYTYWISVVHMIFLSNLFLIIILSRILILYDVIFCISYFYCPILLLLLHKVFYCNILQRCLPTIILAHKYNS